MTPHFLELHISIIQYRLIEPILNLKVGEKVTTFYGIHSPPSTQEVTPDIIYFPNKVTKEIIVNRLLNKEIKVKRYH